MQGSVGTRAGISSERRIPLRYAPFWHSVFSRSTNFVRQG